MVHRFPPASVSKSVLTARTKNDSKSTVVDDSTSGADRLDVEFSVPMIHRLRFTRDCLGEDWAAISELLEPSVSQPTKVQCWIDQGVLDRNDWLQDRLRQKLADQPRVSSSSIHAIVGGEDVKNDSRWVNRILQTIDEEGLDRRSFIVVIGGGAVLDAVGYAAGIAHRGIRLIRLPTTTLAGERTTMSSP